MSQNKTIIIKVPQLIVDKIFAIKEKNGITFTSEVIRNAINSYYADEFKTYGYAKDTLTPGSGVLKLPKMTKEQKEEKKQIDICMALNGTIKDQNGNKTCHYTIYEKVNPKLVNKFEQGLPLSMLSKDTIARQYSPNREEVEQVLEQQEQ